MRLSRQNRGVLLLTPPTTQFRIVGKAPFTRIRPICLDSGGIKTREGRFVMTGTREKNPNWRGGKTISAHGYVLVRVGTDHHLADVRGYAYEHRVLAEETIGRRLRTGEMVHHKDGNKANNAPGNLEVMAGIAEHLVKHRTTTGRRLPGEDNPLMGCECGCGASFSKYDSSGRPRRFISGHNMYRRQTE